MYPIKTGWSRIIRIFIMAYLVCAIFGFITGIIVASMVGA